MKKIFFILLLSGVAFGCKDRSGAEVEAPLKDRVQNSPELKALEQSTIALMNARLDHSVELDLTKQAQVSAEIVNAKSKEQLENVFKRANVKGYKKLAELTIAQNEATFNLAKKFPELKNLSVEERNTILDLKLEVDPILRKKYTDSLQRSQL